MNFSSLKIKTQIITSIGIPLILLMTMGGIVIYSINSLFESSRWVEHTNKVITDGETLLSNGVNMETGMRGYLLAGDEAFLEPYISGKRDTLELLIKLKQTVNDNPGQVRRLEKAEKLLREWQDKVATNNIQLRREINNAKTMNDMANLVGKARGKQLFDKFRVVTQRIHEDSVARLLDAKDNIENTIKSTPSGAKDIQLALNSFVHEQQINDAIDTLFTEAINMETGLRGFQLTGDETFLKPYYDGRDTFSRLQENLKELLGDNSNIVKQLEEMVSLIKHWQETQANPSIEMRRQISVDKDMEDMAELIGQAHGKVFFDQFRQVMNEFKLEEQKLLVERKAVNKEVINFTHLMVTLSVAIAVLLLAVGFLITRNIIRPLTETINAISTTATQLSSTADEHERTASNQASAVNETVTTISELNISARQSTEKADEAVSSANQALQVAGEGQQFVEQTLQGMDEIKEKSNSISEQIFNLSEQTSQIGIITRLVTDIASETKMLALNASVEATHAGEHGKGFAVVASEIRKLADQSKKSAERINNLVDMIQKTTNTTTMVAEQGVISVDKGGELSREVSTSFMGIIDVVNDSYTNMQQIALNNRQQSDATTQISEAMGTINAGARETSSGISQTRTSLHSLNDIAQKLRQSI